MMLLLPVRRSPLKEIMCAETLDTGIRILGQIAASIAMPSGHCHSGVVLVVECLYYLGRWLCSDIRTLVYITQF